MGWPPLSSSHAYSITARETRRTRYCTPYSSFILAYPCSRGMREHKPRSLLVKHRPNLIFGENFCAGVRRGPGLANPESPKHGRALSALRAGAPGVATRLAEEPDRRAGAPARSANPPATPQRRDNVVAFRR